LNSARGRPCKFFTLVTVDAGSPPQADDRAAATAVAELRGLYASSDEPFFLACGFVRPHYPFVLPAALAARARNGSGAAFSSSPDECGAEPGRGSKRRGTFEMHSVFPSTPATRGPPRIRNHHVPAAAAPRPVPTEYPRRGRGGARDPSPRNIHVAAAASTTSAQSSRT